MIAATLDMPVELPTTTELRRLLAAARTEVAEYKRLLRMRASLDRAEEARRQRGAANALPSAKGGGAHSGL